MASVSVNVETRRTTATLWIALALLKVAAFVLRHGIQYRVSFGRHRGRWRTLPIALEITEASGMG